MYSNAFLVDADKELVPLVKMLKKRGLYGKFLSYSFTFGPIKGNSLGFIPIRLSGSKGNDICDFIQLEEELKMAHGEGRIRRLMLENGIKCD
jgi:hypothetical protein